jgi:WD40 repeat protein
MSVGAALLLCATASLPAQTLQPTGTLQMPTKAYIVTISPAGNEVAVLGSDSEMRTFDVAGGKLIRALNRDGREVRGLSYSRNGKRLAIAFKGGSVRVVETASGTTVRALTPTEIDTYLLALSPDGRHLAVGPADASPELWDVERGVRVATLRTPFAGSSAFAFSPDGRLLASADADAVIRVYDVATGTLRTRFDNLLMSSFTVAFSPDSKTLVIGGADRVVVAIDPMTGRELRRLTTQRDPVGLLAVLGDGYTVAASFFDVDHMSRGKNTVAWDLRTGRSKVLASGKVFDAATVTADGRLILATLDGDSLKLSTIR